MGAAEKIDITGAKGGSTSPKAPIEAADSLRSTNLAKILIAVGEGEFDGTPTAANIYLDNTPINDASGNVNFPNVKWEWRTGAIDQHYIPGIPSVENETTVNVELRSDTAWVRSLTNTQLSAVRLRFAWPALQQQDENGNVGGYRIEYAIDVATDGGAYQQVLDEAVDGKTTTRYERSRRIDLPPATTGWQIRVRRITPNQNTNKIADTMLVAGYTEVIDAKLRYPNTALLYIEFDAEQFTNIPAVTVDCNGRKWQVPSNYDPVTRSYAGVWDGTFKSAWTNNPAWVTFGICTVDRFGLGKRIKPFMVDKWELYRIAQYCDQMVPDGIGGQEPRFLCDMNLQGKAEAWTLLRDISAIYRGMTYWAEGQIVMQADMPRAQDFDYVFTRANVIDGKFSYGSASTKTRYTRAIVSYDNPANNYDTDVTAFADPDLQRRFGDKPVEISAIGCTRASEAQRRGKWAVLSNNQDRTVTFKTGMEGAIPLPGYIIPVADSLLAGREIGGRISAAAGRVVTLDRDTQAKAGDRLIINLSSGKAEGRTVQSVAGRAVTVTTAYSETPAPQLQWALDADDLAIPLYRVLSRKRTAEGDYEIAALQFEPSKFAYIDTGAKLEDRPISVIPITVVPAPASVTLSATSAIDQGIAVTTMTITWPAVNGAVGYDVEWRKDNGNWIKVQRTGSTSVDITGIYSGAYLARVRAVSAYDISSIWRSSMLTQLNGKEGLPPAVTSLTTESLIFGIGLKWTFPPGAEDTQRTELWYSEAPQLDSATKLADLSYPQSDYTMQGLRAGQSFFFWARLVDRTGNVGPWFPQAPTVVNGQASADADDILDYLTGEITESQLGQELLGEIGKIGGDGPGSVNERLDQVRTDLGDQITDVNNTVTEVHTELQAQIDQIADLADSMPYKADQAYTAGQGVLGADGIIYQALKNVPVNTPPPNTEFWLNVGQAVQTANGLAARVTTTETKITSIEGVNTAQANQITGLQTSLDGKADSSVVSSLSSRVTTAENTISSQGSAITGLQNSVAGKADASAVSALTTRVTSAEGTISSQGNRVTSLENSVNSATTGLATKASASSVDSLTNRVTATETGLTSVSGQLTQLTNSIGSMGGDNLLPNSSFEDLATNGAPTNWQIGSSASATPTLTMVDSPLSSSTKAVRLARAALANGGYIDLNLSATDKPKVTAGKSYTLSVYARLSSPSARFAAYVQWMNDTGSVISTIQIPETQVSTTFTRLSFTGVAPAGAVKANIYAGRLLNRSGATADMWIEIDNVQLQEGATLTAYSPSVQSVATQAAATSAAVDSLTSTVTQQGTTLTSVAARTTSLENAVNSTTDGLSTKASASALQTLGNRVTSVEGTLTSQSSDITNLKNTIGSAAPFVAGYAWEMTGSTRGWTANVSGATITAGALFATVSKYTQIQATSSFGNLNGSENPFLRIRLRRKNTTRASAAMYWANEDGGLAEARRFNWPINLNTEDWQDIELDLSGHTGWNGKTGIYAIRVDMNNSADANSVIDIGYIAVGRRSAAGSAQALSSLTTTVTQQGATISSQSQQITGLQTSVGANTAQLQQQATTIADSAGKISAAYSVRLQVAQNGLNYVAGFGIGLDNSSGVLQSQFIVAADRFAVIRDVAGNVSSPFIIEGGQVFIADAVIKKATIVNGIIGQSISSATMTNYGVPVMIVDYNSGAIAINNKATNGKSLILREDGLFATSGGVTILELRV